MTEKDVAKVDIVQKIHRSTLLVDARAGQGPAREPVARVGQGFKVG